MEQAIRDVSAGHAQRVCAPGLWAVWRDDAGVHVEVKAINDKVEALSDRQTKTETRVDKVLGNVRAFGAGMAAAFTLIGTALGAGLSSILEWLK